MSMLLSSQGYEISSFQDKKLVGIRITVIFFDMQNFFTLEDTFVEISALNYDWNEKLVYG